MKKILIASTLAIVASASNADNTSSVTTTLSAYVSQGLGVTAGAELKFPDIVKPAVGAGNYTVRVLPSDGSVEYTGRAAPGGGLDGSNKQNATGNSTLGQHDSAVGTIGIKGEPGYTLRLSIDEDDSGDPTPGMSYASLVGADNTPGAATLVLDGDGEITVSYGGTLTVGEAFVLSTGSVTTLSLIARVDYM